MSKHNVKFENFKTIQPAETNKYTNNEKVEHFRVYGGMRVYGVLPECDYGYCHKHTVKIVEFTRPEDLKYYDIRL